MPARLAAAASLAAAALILLIPALLNGFPFVFYDSGDYLQVLDGTPALYRDPVYGVMIAPLHRLGGLWAVPLAQAAVLAWVLRQTLVAWRPGPPDRLLPAVAAWLTALTGLPFFVGQVMPDALAGVTVLGVALLAGGGIAPARRAALFALVVAAAASHLSHLLVALGLVVVLAALRLARRPLRLAAAPRLGAPMAAVALALLAIPTVSAALGGRLALSQTGHVFLLGSMLQQGLVAPYLAATCPQAGWSLCPWRDRLPGMANDFLWGDSPAFTAMGGWAGAEPEAAALTAAVLRHDPLAALAAAAGATLRQVVTLASGDGLVPQTEAWSVIERRFPADFAAYRAARQQRRALDFAPLNAVHVPLALGASLAIPLLAALAWRRRAAPMLLPLLVVGAGLLLNAAVCGALSNPGDRYQSRVAWIAVLAAGCAAAAPAWRRTPRPVAAPAPGATAEPNRDAA